MAAGDLDLVNHAERWVRHAGVSGGQVLLYDDAARQVLYTAPLRPQFGNGNDATWRAMVHVDRCTARSSTWTPLVQLTTYAGPTTRARLADQRVSVTLSDTPVTTSSKWRTRLVRDALTVAVAFGEMVSLDAAALRRSGPAEPVDGARSAGPRREPGGVGAAGLLLGVGVAGERDAAPRRRSRPSA